MPIYAYRCATCGHAKDVLQRISDPLLTLCPACGKPTFSKQVTAAGFQLKGSGWYVTDFKDGAKAPKADAAKDGAAADNSAAAASNGATGDGASANGNAEPAAGAKASESAAPAAAPAAAAAPPAGSSPKP